jgi:TatD DNase family protein
VAVHPNETAKAGGAASMAGAAEHGDGAAGVLADISALAKLPQVRAVGETGLDYYRTRDDAGQARQRASFAGHIAIAVAHGLTLVIHDRDAHADILATLDDAPVRPDRVIMHCFSGDAELARQCVARGYWLSFPGTVTFRDASGLRDALAVTPADRLLVETDAPYLTPVPARGRPNASYLIPHLVRFIAGQRGDDVATLCDALSANAEAAYGGPWGTP